MEKNEAKSLDKYYTNIDVAKECCDNFFSIVDKKFLVEPSAGAGAFINASSRPIYGFDIYPENESIARHDFVNDDFQPHIDNLGIEGDFAFIGNPPFGKKGKLAIDFINRALNFAPVVGFILPIQFRKWSTHKQINKSARLVVDNTLPDDSFTIVDQPYSLRCSFQVWSLGHLNLPDQRIISPPKTSHDDFEMWQFNCTQMAQKYFDYDWDFAVPRQGYNDYSIRARNLEEVNNIDPQHKKQWIFFKSSNDIVLNRLLSLDFGALSLLNSGIPGFGKADVVKEYCEQV